MLSRLQLRNYKPIMVLPRLLVIYTFKISAHGVIMMTYNIKRTVYYSYCILFGFVIILLVILHIEGVEDR